MNIADFANKLEKVATVKNVGKGEYEIITGAKINTKTPIKVYLIEDGDQIKFSDKKATLKFMNTIYELKSLDVKNCIASVIKIYGFSVASGELVGVVRTDSSLIETFYNFIICIGQLANMYAFFDKPE